MTLILIVPVTIVFLLTYVFTTDTSQARHDHKCIVWAGQIDDERYRLDTGISDKWYEWRDDLQRHMVECFEIPPEESMNYDPYA